MRPSKYGKVAKEVISTWFKMAATNARILMQQVIEAKLQTAPATDTTEAKHVEVKKVAEIIMIRENFEFLNTINRKHHFKDSL